MNNRTRLAGWGWVLPALMYVCTWLVAKVGYETLTYNMYSTDRTIVSNEFPSAQSSTPTICPGNFLLRLLFEPGLNIRTLPGGDLPGNGITGTFGLADGQREATEEKKIGVDTYFHLKDSGWIWNKRLEVVCLAITATATVTATVTPTSTLTRTPAKTPTPVSTVQPTPGWWITFGGVSTFCMDPCKPEFSRELPTRVPTSTRLP